MKEIDAGLKDINDANEDIEKERFGKLLEWLIGHGADFSKLELVFYSADYRGIVAKTDIKKDEIALLVPYDISVSVEHAK